MTQKELIKNVADKTGMTQADVGRVLTALALEVQTQVRAGERVVVPSIGIFSRVFRQAREIKNKLGDYQVPASFRPRFKPLKGFKEAVGTASA